MINDLKIIKKKYGEGMMHLCRNLFPIILETNGLLSNLLLDHFNDDRQLYEDIVNNQLETEFKNYIYSVFDKKNEVIKNTDKSPKELLDSARYNFYECYSEEDIQKFKRYYAKNEELCTFKGNRLDRCYVFFAVKKDVDKIKREDFENPQRQDLYGTSVISIQFTKDESHMLSIKNRYNHRVANPDATFSNDLDRIIPGLTDSFEKHYGIYQKCKSSSFEIPEYVKASDNKYYKYNVEINNIYYCTNNVIIKNYCAKEYPKDQYLIMDYFILDLKNKTITTCDKIIRDGFIKMIGKIDKINIEKNKDGKVVTINSKGSVSTIYLNKNNQIVGLINNDVKKINSDFLSYNKTLKELKLQNVQIIENDFLCDNQELKVLYLPSLEIAKSEFLNYNIMLEKIDLPKLKEVGNNFLFYNDELRKINLPKLQITGNDFMYYNMTIEEAIFPNLEITGNRFFYFNNKMKEFYIPLLKTIGNGFLENHSCFQNPLINSTGCMIKKANEGKIYVKTKNN